MKQIIPMERLAHGQSLPDKYRIAYYEHDTFMAVAYPIGIHLIVKYVKRFLDWTTVYSMSKLERLLFEQRKKGQQASFARGYAQGLMDGQKAMGDRVLGMFEAGKQAVEGDLPKSQK